MTIKTCVKQVGLVVVSVLIVGAALVGLAKLIEAVDMSWPPHQCDAHAVMLKGTVADCSTQD